MYPELAHHFYKYIHRIGKCKNKHIPLSTFRMQCEKILSMLDDAVIIETYVRYGRVVSSRGLHRSVR